MPATAAPLETLDAAGDPATVAAHVESRHPGAEAVVPPGGQPCRALLIEVE